MSIDHPRSRSERPLGAEPAALEGGLIVSCQAAPGSPLHGPVHMTAMAHAAELGGAVAIRANGTADVRAIASSTALPLIGLWKDGDDGVYITPTVGHAVAVAEAGADIVAVDGTARPRPDGETLGDIIVALHARGVLVMADVSTFEEGIAASEAGSDLVSTTLSGYTPDSPPGPEPDFGLITALSSRLSVPVIAEGRLRTPDDVSAAFRAGAFSVVVGTAITAPTWITRRFADAAPCHLSAPLP
ncbi:N-acetylmannosamine-6-phosphate 2-epimerase [Streptomyces sp. NPDC058221]|uniref:N-acetylmannosamine-6-phosphate 2-epimerase n=1 Tax=Streptomyces sp. NPDC058221 TaxID=3346388 RepID=UPI0036E082C3